MNATLVWSSLQWVPQFIGSHQSARLGRGQRHQVETTSEVHSRIRRLSRPDNHRSNKFFFPISISVLYFLICLVALSFSFNESTPPRIENQYNLLTSLIVGLMDLLIEWLVCQSLKKKGPHVVRWNGRLVQSGEANWQISCFGSHPVAHQCRNQGRRKGQTSLSLTFFSSNLPIWRRRWRSRNNGVDLVGIGQRS